MVFCGQIQMKATKRLGRAPRLARRSMVVLAGERLIRYFHDIQRRICGG